MNKTNERFNLFTSKSLFLLIYPIVIEATLTMSLGLFDGFMVSNGSGSLGDAQLTAVSYVDQISNLIIQLFSAFGVGGAVITSQFLGANNVEDADRSAKQLVWLMIFISLGVTALCLIFNHQIINLFFGELDQTTLNYAYSYFYVTSCSYPFLAVFYAAAALLRAQRKSLNTMTSAAISFVINVGFNAIFIYGCKLQVVGAGLGTLIARIFPAIFLMILLAKKDNVVSVKLFDKFKFDGKVIKKISKLAIPSGIENCFFQLGKILVLSFISLKCYNIIVNGASINFHSSANSVVMSINTIGCVIGNGINTSILTVIGQAVGTGILAQVKYYARKMMILSYIGNIVNVAVVWALSVPLISIFNITPEASELAIKCVTLCFSFQLITYPLSFGMSAILKANSDVRYVMVCSIISMVVMRVGLCYVLTTDQLPFQLGAVGLWIGMVSDWVLRSILFLARFLSGKWKNASGLLNGVEQTNEVKVVASEKID